MKTNLKRKAIPIDTYIIDEQNLSFDEEVYSSTLK